MSQPPKPAQRASGPDRPATIRDVAALARVSVATVSRVVHNQPNVQPHLRKAVEEAIETTRYRLRSSSAGKGRRGLRIGLVIPDITNAYFPLVIRGVCSNALVHGAEILLCNADNNSGTEQKHIERLLEQHADGVIYIPFLEPIEDPIAGLLETGVPIVFLDREHKHERLCAVLSDNEEGAFQAITYLLNLGHRSIVFIAGPESYSTTVSRASGYRRGFREMGLAYREELVIHGDTTYDSAYRATARLLDSRAPFTAIFASNDMMAFGAWKALEDRGLRVPEDVSIIGYDDVPLSAIMSLTTIAQPAFEIGRNALTLAVDLIEGRRQAPQRVLLRDSLIIRKSTRGLSGDGTKGEPQ